MTVAAFLRTHRRRAGLTLDALETRTGLTKSYLSKIERGLSNPSIAVALQIAEALNTDVGQLFSERGDDSTMAVQRSSEHAIADTSTTTAVYTPIAAHMIKKSMQPFIMHPTTEQGSTFMEHPGEEFLHVQSGTVEVTIPDQVIYLDQGDSLYFDSSTPHRVRSTSTPRAVLLVVVYDRHDEDETKRATAASRRRCGARQ